MVDTLNDTAETLRPNTTDGASPATVVTSVTSTGFTTTGTGDYIYAAWSQSASGSLLTLTDNTGLTEFSPGDEVEQNGGGTPQTSAITNVAGTLYSSWLSTPAGTVRDPSQGFNGDLSNSAGSTVNSNPIVWTPPGGISYSTSVEVYTGSTARLTLRYAVNGGSTQQSCLSTTTEWKTIVTGSGTCLLYTSPSPRDRTRSRMPSSA